VVLLEIGCFCILKDGLVDYGFCMREHGFDLAVFLALAFVDNCYICMCFPYCSRDNLLERLDLLFYFRYSFDFLCFI